MIAFKCIEMFCFDFPTSNTFTENNDLLTTNKRFKKKRKKESEKYKNKEGNIKHKYSFSGTKMLTHHHTSLLLRLASKI